VVPGSGLQILAAQATGLPLSTQGPPGPPARLDDWIGKWEAGEDSYKELENSTEMAKSLRASFFKRAGG